MHTLHFKNIDIIQIIVEMICHNITSAVVRTDLLEYGRENLGYSVIPHIHMKSVENSRVTAVCSNNINLFRNWILCLSTVWTAGVSWSTARLWFVKPKIHPNPPVLGANLLDIFQETLELCELVLPVMFLCRIGNRKSCLDICVPLSQ